MSALRAAVIRTAVLNSIICCLYIKWFKMAPSMDFCKNIAIEMKLGTDRIEPVRGSDECELLSASLGDEEFGG